jgi:hypothetical protein
MQGGINDFSGPSAASFAVPSVVGFGGRTIDDRNEMIADMDHIFAVLLMACFRLEVGF